MGTLSANVGSLNFGSITDGLNRLETVTLTNNGNRPITITKATVSGAGFTLVQTMTSVSIPAKQKYNFEVKFAPVSGGPVSGSVTLTSNATNTSLRILLDGTGVVRLAITAEPASETVTAGGTATFSVTAVGTGTLTYQWRRDGIFITGATGSSYTTPPATTAETGAEYEVVVTDANGSISSIAAILTVKPAPVAVSALNASQASLNFSSVNIGSQSVLPVVFSNSGTAQITISNITVSGAGYTASGMQTGQILAAGSSATLDVTFAPAATGAHTGSVTVTSNASDPSVPIALSGTGVQQPVSRSATLAWSASTSTVSGYNAYRATVSGGPYTKLNSAPVSTTSYADGAVQSSQTYYYVVTSVDGTGVESLYSAEVTATIP